MRCTTDVALVCAWTRGCVTWKDSARAGAASLGEVRLLVGHRLHFKVLGAGLFHPNVDWFARQDDAVAPCVGNVVSSARLAVRVQVAVAAVRHTVRSLNFVMKLAVLAHLVPVYILGCKSDKNLITKIDRKNIFQLRVLNFQENLRFLDFFGAAVAK